jgi:hypothetical protein
MLVEDEDLKGVVIGIMRHHLGSWPSKQEEEKWPTYITVAHSAQEVLKEDGLIAQLQESSVKALGIVVDANSSYKTRWERIRNFCRKHGVKLNDVCPETGLIVDNILNTKFGAWIMPNNKDDGMLENFCHALVPLADNKPLWDFAESSATHAREKLNACFIPTHVHKAQMHTWLAWQDPPGERMGSAITQRILKAELGWGKAFADWFRALYGV